MVTNHGSSGAIPVTPTYRDFETNTQKTVYNTTNTGWGLSVFHEPIPNNSIPDFATGNNTFCVDGAIWQNPNDGPIIGNTPLYTSGDGSLPTHNIPNTVLGAHPIPASPALQYRWQKSLNGGTNWINVGNGSYDVYKPSPEPAAGTVQYRRTILGFSAIVPYPSPMPFRPPLRVISPYNSRSCQTRLLLPHSGGYRFGRERYWCLG